MADGTSVVSDRWGTSAGPRALRERSQYASRLRLPAAAEDRRNCSQVSPRAGRLPSGRGPNADRPFDEPATSTARRVAAATWMMSSTTVASRAYAVVPARRSRWSRGGASRPSSAPAAGSARHRADASRRDRAARSPDPQPASCRRPFRRGFRARAARSTRHRWCPRPDQQPLSGCVGRDVLAGVRIPVKPITRSGGKPITCSGANRSPVPTQTDHLSERSDAGRNHESRFSVRVDGRLRFRIESPFRSSLYALCTRRSRIALASVGSPMTSCHLRLPPISRTG